jgi:hypothetical protein
MGEKYSSIFVLMQEAVRASFNFQQFSNSPNSLPQTMTRLIARSFRGTKISIADAGDDAQEARSARARARDAKRERSR